MYNLFTEFISNFITLLNQMSFYILLGIFVASILKFILPDDFIKRHLGTNSFKSVLKASLIGIPLPLCSCSVIPFVASLKESGASKSSIQTFLISTPITGADSILATYGVLGGVFTIFRLISSLIISIIAGILSILLLKSDKNLNRSSDNQQKCSCNCSCKSVKKQHSFRDIVDYAFNSLFKDIAKPLLIGLLVGASLSLITPADLKDIISDNYFVSYIIALAIATPLYVCATASIPIGASLLALGFPAGAVLMFLTAGPATNAVTISVVLSNLGKKSLIIYLSSIIIGSFIFGFILDYLSISLNLDLNTIIHDEDISFIDYISSAILSVLMIFYTFKK